MSKNNRLAALSGSAFCRSEFSRVILIQPKEVGTKTIQIEIEVQSKLRFTG